MFTGIVEELGTVRRVEPGRDRAGARIEIAAAIVLDDIEIGASMAINGCCLTVVRCDAAAFAVDAVPETLARTTLGQLAPGDTVNLERPLRLADRLGGHLVQGHVDGTATLAARAEEADGSARLTFTAPAELLPHVVEKGSVALDGVSLTIAALTADGFEVALIPHTLAVTTLGERAPGRCVNIEVDMLSRHVARLLAVHTAGRELM